MNKGKKHTEEKKRDSDDLPASGKRSGNSEFPIQSRPPPKQSPGYNIAYAAIDTIHFGINSTADNRALAVASITDKRIMANNIPVFGGPYDANLGTTEGRWNCAHCQNKKPYCLGHFGETPLRFPVKYPGWIQTIIQYAKVCCLECGAFMLGKKRIVGIKKSRLLALYAAAVRNKKKTVKQGEENIKTNLRCPKCDAEHPVSISIDKNSFKQAQNVVLSQSFYDARGELVESRLYNHKLWQAFDRVSDETVAIVGKPPGSHPRNLITNFPAIPSNIIRPDKKVISGNRSSNDDLTTFIKYIVEKNSALPETIPDVIDLKLDEKYNELEQMYFNLHMSSADKNTAKHQQSLTSNMDGIGGRIPLKKGRIRGDLVGGRTFLAARSVITGDPRLPLHVVGIPYFMARKLYTEVTVSEHNYTQCMTYFKNGVHFYPGVRRIIKKSTNATHSIDRIREDIVPEIGDILICDLMDGDKIMFGRQPSLWDLSINCFDVQVMFDGDTIRFNPINCVRYQADFDGDEMLLIATSHLSASIEIDAYASVANSATNHQDGGAISGMFQNSLWFVSKMTTNGTIIGREQMMDTLAYIPNRVHLPDPNKMSYTGREAVSLTIPSGISLKGTPLMYNPALNGRYDPTDIAVEIKNGQLVSGVLDKAIIGQRKIGSLFHKITHLYGPQKSNATIYAMQQLADAFGDIYGGTVHLGDMMLSPDVQKIVQQQTESVITKSILFHDRWRRQQIIPPIDMTAIQFHESQQIEILQLTEHKSTIALALDMNKNNLAHSVSKCGKGDPKNIESLLAAVGQQQIRGRRLSAYEWRGSAYFPFFSPDPGAHGFISSSFTGGLAPFEQMALSEDVRYQLIQIQMNTPLTGHAARESIKNFESIVIDNWRRLMRQGRYVIQPLYGYQGVDMRFIVHTSIGHIFLNDAAFEANYKNPAPGLEAEFATLAADRDMLRTNTLRLESEYMDPRLGKGKLVVAFDIDLVISYVITSKSEDSKSAEADALDPLAAVETVAQFCKDLPYVFSNRFEKEKQAPIPFAHQVATTAACIVIRDRLCTRALERANIGNRTLKFILQTIFIKYKQALANPGTAAGIIASQALSEMYTQFMLNSKHRQGSDVTNQLRGIEIVVARHTEGMKNPKMLLHVKPEYRNNKEKVEEIASQLEMVTFGRFVASVDVFGGEQYDRPSHPQMADQKEYIATMRKYQGVDAPADLSSYVIKFKLNVSAMIQSYMPMDIIEYALRAYSEKFHIVRSPETAAEPSIACYVRVGALTHKSGHRMAIDALIDMIQSTNLRGVPGIKAASVHEFSKSVINSATGEIKQENVWVIRTRGTNLRAILAIEELDADLCQTDSIHEVAEVLGIMAAYRKIVTEMWVSFPGPAFAHYSIFASEMTFTGEVTGVTKAGAGARDNDVLPRASYTSPIPVLVDAAINGVSNKVCGASASLMLGAAIDGIGTSSVSVIIDEDAVSANVEDISDLL